MLLSGTVSHISLASPLQHSNIPELLLVKQLLFVVPLHVLVSTVTVACQQALWGNLAAGWEKEGELATTSLEYEYILESSLAGYSD